jgi:hypothetical protein
MVMKLKFCLFLFAVIILSSCSSSKKFDYASAYRFKQVKTTPSVKPETIEAQPNLSVPPAPSDQHLIASNRKQAPILLPTLKLEKPQMRAPEKVVTKTLSSLSKEEKRELKQFLKEKIKEEKLAAREVKRDGKQLKAEKKTQDLTPNVRTGLILGGVGIVLLILGGVNGVLAFAGTILVLAGVVFILMDVL